MGTTVRDAKNALVLVTLPKQELTPAWRVRLDDKQKRQLRAQCIVAGVDPDEQGVPNPDLDEMTPSGNQEEKNMTKLYQTKEETPRFGIKLATNSAGKAVLEMKGTGETLTFDHSEIEEVKPYTVRVRFFYNKTGASCDREYEYIAKKGSVKVGDVLDIAGSSGLATVVKVDTKSDLATTVLKGRKVAMEPIDSLDIGE